MALSPTDRGCRRATVALLALMVCAPGALRAQDDFFNPVEIVIDGDRSAGAFSVIGWASQKVGWGLQAPGPLFSRQDSELNQVETSLFLQLDGSLAEGVGFRVSGKFFHDEIYRVKTDNPYTFDELNEFRNRYEVRDLYLEAELSDRLYVKLGHQILAWGQAEYLRVTDLINIEDQYTFLQQDLEDLRLQVPALLASWSAEDWVIDTVITLDAGRNNMAPAGDEFDQLLQFRRTDLALDRTDPATEHEVFIRASTSLPQGDLELVAGEFNDNALSVNRIDRSDPALPLVNFTQNRMRALGVSANWVEGQWLYFGELGLHKGVAIRPSQETFLSRQTGWEERDQVLAVAGVEYSGFSNLRLTFEVDGVHTRRHDDGFWIDEQQVGVGARAYWTALNERLQVLGVWTRLGNDAGRVGRLSVEYNWSDNLGLGLLWVDYNSNNSSIFRLFENNDVLQFQLRYSFQN